MTPSLSPSANTSSVREHFRLDLFRSTVPGSRHRSGRHRRLTSRPMHRIDAWWMIKRRAKAVGLPEAICNHTFRATGITAYLENGGTIEHAQQIADTRSQQRFIRPTQSEWLHRPKKGHYFPLRNRPGITSRNRSKPWVVGAESSTPRQLRTGASKTPPQPP